MLSNSTQQNLINDARLRFLVIVFLSKASKRNRKQSEKRFIIHKILVD